MQHYGQIYIDGQWAEPLKATHFELVNPATEKPFASVSLAGVEDVHAAVIAARRAFPAFSNTSKAERMALLQRIVDALTTRTDAFLEAVSLELGAPRTMKAHVTAGIDAFKQAVVTLRDYEFETRLGTNIVRREAIGVCGLITAWNWPIQLLCTKISAALAAGCTIVAKPSEFTPITAIILTEALHEAGVPKGVFNLVLGDGPHVGNAISAHPDIDIVSFTGSTRAGVLIAEAAAASVKRVSQELGGKSPHIILPDADLEAAARWNVSRGFSNTGQSCHAPTRVLVHEDQLESVLGFMLDEVRKVRVGNPQEPATTMGPVVNAAQFERVQSYIRSGIGEGARLVCGGPGRPDGLERGYFIRPTIFADVNQTMAIAREEIFGPVLAVMTYKSDEEAIQIANATDYGLGGYIWTAADERGLALGRQIRAGRVFLNGAPGNTAAPMGGYKQSGNGREMGVFGLEEYLEVKALIGFVRPPQAA
jgi:aldehyde dehydrogenase (NAD+)